jgi:tetraacyldisaccharide 4'-kinase
MLQRFEQLLSKKQEFFLLRFFIQPFLFFLSILSYCYSFVMTLRNLCYDLGILKHVKLSMPVISIGNITTGGTGKTPITMFFIENLGIKKNKITVISKGYRALKKRKSPFIACEGRGPCVSFEECGDEPFLISKKYPDITMVIASKKWQAAVLAQKNSPKCVIIDDAFQHRALYRDYNIVVINTRDPFSNGYVLPRGKLREPLKGLARADFIIFHNANSKEDVLSLLPKVTRHTKAPWICTKVLIKGVYLNKTRDPVPLEGKKVGVFCALGDPSSFFQTVESLGCSIVKKAVFSDHEQISLATLEGFAKEAYRLGAEFIVSTEKDLVKYSFQNLGSLPVAVIEIKVAITHGEANWKDLVEKIT